jgi:P27 family predicted phage terminase small subunit
MTAFSSLAIPETLAGLPELNLVAKAEWDRIAKLRGQLRTLTELDRAALAIYSTVYAIWVEAQKMIKKNGAMVRSPKDFPMQSPYIGLANRQAEIMLRIASGFGFAPASRAQMVSPQANPMLPPFESDGQD